MLPTTIQTQLPPSLLDEPVTRLDGPLPVADARGPLFGPGWEDPAPSRPSLNDITFSVRDMTGPGEERMSGVHGVIGYDEPDHFGYQEGTGPNPTIDRNLPTARWDEIPTSSTGGYV